MEIYFYCSYAHSARGFFLTGFDGRELVPVDMGRSPEKINDFFSYGRFFFLWQELNLPGTLSRTGAFLGLREIKGTLKDGRSAVANLAFLADENEISWIRRAALDILGDYEAFEHNIISWVSVGGQYGYELDAAAFNAWFEGCRGKNILRKNIKKDDAAHRLLMHMADMNNPRREPELIRLTAMTASWEYDGNYFGTGPEWESKPSGVLSVDEFDRIFRGRGCLWSMETEGM